MKGKTSRRGYENKWVVAGAEGLHMNMIFEHEWRRKSKTSAYKFSLFFHHVSWAFAFGFHGQSGTASLLVPKFQNEHV
jgi:hypothetical protein